LTAYFTRISDNLKEAYKMKTISLEQYVAEIDKAEAWMEGEEEGRKKGEEEGKFEVARTMLSDGLPVETIRKYTGLDEGSILHCVN
jgi:predicted transposase/invertase (TIGR01784 family)